MRKIALYFAMHREMRARRRLPDARADDAIFDDLGINNWLDRVEQAGGVPNTLYTEARRR